MGRTNGNFETTNPLLDIDNPTEKTIEIIELFY
jgi:hypothetical protein